MYMKKDVMMVPDKPAIPNNTVSSLGCMYVARNYVMRAATQPQFAVNYSPGPCCKPRKLERFSSPCVAGGAVKVLAYYMYIIHVPCKTTQRYILTT